MSKRPAGGNPSSRPRRRRKNGVWMATRELDLQTDAPAQATTMHIWHSNAKYPAGVQQTTTPLPKSQDPPPIQQTDDFEVLDAAGAAPTAT